jgi:hypothetical protein
MGERSSICCVGARSTLHEQQTHQKLGREPAWQKCRSRKASGGLERDATTVYRGPAWTPDGAEIFIRPCNTGPI